MKSYGTSSQPLAACSALALLVLLSGCTATGIRPTSVSAPSEKPAVARHHEAVAALQRGDTTAARAGIAAALRDDPRNGYWHLLNGLSYELERESSPQQDLAAVGFDAAVRFAPGFYWAHYHDGLIALDRHQYEAASEQFAQAILADPQRPEAFVGLAAAAYQAGDLAVARLAATRAMQVAPADPLVLRTAAFVAAASGDSKRLEVILTKASAVPAAERDLQAQRGRFSQLLRFAAVGAGEPAAPGAKVSRTPGEPDLSQVMVEVTLLLSQNSQTRRAGINLLDGLSLQFNGNRQFSNSSSPNSDISNRITTAALSVPQINYSLNIFNTRDDHYEVLARPSLVASLNQTSEFFIGRTLTVAVSGVNLGSLQPVDVGTSVKISPTEITPQGAKFRVEATRSFFTADNGGNFQQSLTTFKQSVNATVTVEYGKTMILSGLYENVNIGGDLKTPVLGDVPGLSTLFKAKTNTTRQDAALVLVTPRQPGTISSGTGEFRGETLQRLLSFWSKVVEPNSGLDSIVGVIQRKNHFAQPLAGDLRLPTARDAAVLTATLTDTSARLR